MAATAGGGGGAAAAAAPTAAVVAGPLMSSLLYEQWAADNDMEAFLLGHVQTTVTETLSDADVPVKQTFVRYRVHSFKMLPDVYAFYNQAGAVDMPAVERLLGAWKQRVIGWLRCRRNSPPQPYLREAAVHEDLCRRLNRPCVLWLATSSLATPEGATHDLDYVALAPTLQDGQLVSVWQSARVPIDVLNLVESTQSAYTGFVAAAAPAEAAANGADWHQAFATISLTPVVNELQRVHGTLQAQIDGRLKQLTAATAKLHALHSRIGELERRRAEAVAATAAAAAASSMSAQVAGADANVHVTQLPPPPAYEDLPPALAPEAPQPTTLVDLDDGPETTPPSPPPSEAPQTRPVDL